MESLLLKNDLMYSEERDDFNYYSKIEELDKYPKNIIVRLNKVIKFSQEIRDPTLKPDVYFKYIDIANIVIHDGTINVYDVLGKNAPSRARKVVHSNEIVISTVRPYRRAVAIVPKELDNQICSTGFAICKVNSSVNINYLFNILRSDLVAKQWTNFCTGSSYPAILEKHIVMTKIPLPDRQIQDKIAILMQSAYFLRKQKLYQAEEELKGINYCILKELSINIKDILTKKSVLINFKELKDRDDAIYFTDGFDELKNKLLSLQILTKPVGELLSSLTSGARPKGGVNNIEEGILSLGGLHINNKGDLDFLGKEKYIPYEFHKENISSKIQAKDILIVKDGATTGKIAIVPEDFNEEVNINEHLFRLRLKEDYNIWYVFSYLFSKIGQMQIQHFKSGATVMGITRDAVNSILIPIPNNSTQEKIELDLKNRMGNSKRLTKDAEHIVAYSKLIIEKLIIGQELSKQEEDFANNVIKEAKKLGFIPQ